MHMDGSKISESDPTLETYKMREKGLMAALPVWGLQLSHSALTL